MVAWIVVVAMEKKQCTDLGIFWRSSLEFDKQKEEIGALKDN